MTDNSEGQSSATYNPDEFASELAKLLEYVRKGLDPNVARSILAGLIKRHKVPLEDAKEAEKTLETMLDTVENVSINHELEELARDELNVLKSPKNKLD